MIFGTFSFPIGWTNRTVYFTMVWLSVGDTDALASDNMATPATIKLHEVRLRGTGGRGGEEKWD